jgi:hypothetical protein
VGGLVYYGVGEQDYMAWHAAADQAARRAYGLAPPGQVNAGYESNATYFEIPLYDATGTEIPPLGPGLQGLLLPSIGGPPQPRLRLLFAAPGDARSGVDYRSAASGRIVIAPTAATP